MKIVALSHLASQYMDTVQDDEADGEEMEEESDDEVGSDSQEASQGSGGECDKPVDDQEPESSRRSKAPSPTDSLVEHTASLHLETPLPPSDEGDEGSQPGEDNKRNDDADVNALKDRVASDIVRQQARQARFHSKRSTRKIGRPKGSKAKQDTRVKLDKGGFWD